MCGIFAFLGFVNCFPHGIHGLKKLQNRGYDSAGCCGLRVGQDGNVEMVLAKYATTEKMDSIARLEKEEHLFEGCASGIYHSRWLTHGARTDTNAHPHLDNRDCIALVHNGIIENYHKLKQELETKHDIKLRSETDSEVIVNLISVYYHQDKQDGMERAILKAVSRMSGTWALVVIAKDHPNDMYCARHGSALLLGFGEDSSYVMVASEQAGFGPHVSSYLCLENDDVIVLKRGDRKVSFENVNKYVLRTVTSEVSCSTKPDPFAHWTIKEIHEQCEASLRAINFGGRLLESEVMLGGPIKHCETLRNVRHLVLLGCGTSRHAAEHATRYFKDLCDFTTVQVFDGAEFTTDDLPRATKPNEICALFLSQSGETKDLYRCVQVCRDHNVFTIGVINVVDSLIAREVHCGVYLNAGREVAVASTKAFTSQVIVLSMLAIYFAQIHDLNRDKRTAYVEALKHLPEDLKRTIGCCEGEAKKMAEYLVKQGDLFILGKGSMISVAAEGALKTKEIGYIHSEAYAVSALRHGSYALIQKGTPILFLIPKHPESSLILSVAEEVVSRDAVPMLITDDETLNVGSKNMVHKVVVPHNAIYAGILHNVPLQLIAYYMAALKGHNPDMPRNLSKCVSV